MEKILQNVFIALLLVWLPVALPAFGQSGGQYDLSWNTIDGGGGRSSGGQYILRGTIGQPDAAYSAGGQYELLGGLWPGGPLCFVDFRHFARFAESWWDTPCNAGNNWCQGADLNFKDGVNFADVALFVQQWLCYCPLDWPLK